LDASKNKADHLKRLLRQAAEQLRDAGAEEPERLAEELWLLSTDCTRTQFLLGESKISPSAQLRFEKFLGRALSGEPLAYLAGMAAFYGFEFQVDPRVLVPRMDSECLLDLALEITSSRESGFCGDFGTGSGCLLLSFLAHRPKWNGLGIDLSSEALAVAKKNAESLNLAGQCQWLNGSWEEELELPKLDLMIANPPYVLPGEELGFGVQEHEPALALFTPKGKPMTPYCSLLVHARESLTPNGILLFEIGAGRDEEVVSLCVDNQFKVQEVRRDLGGIKRVVYASRPASI
jgi:release factor glutamine methyltransferase